MLVSLQSLTKAPYSVDIPNSRLIQSCDSGVAKSRNVVLDNSLGKYLVFGDDDITFIESGLIQVIQFFEEHPECAIILAQAINDFGMPRKKYKKYISPLRLYLTLSFIRLPHLPWVGRSNNLYSNRSGKII